MTTAATPYPLVPLGEILTKSEDWIDILPDQRYRQVTIKMWGQGVVQRNEVAGGEIAASRRMRVRTGQFILSRIDARNGAIGVVPPELDGAVVSNDFPAFQVDAGRILPEFLGWMARTHDFVELCKAASEGTTNRVRLQEDRFLALTIPLPPLAEQRRVVARVEEIAAKVAEARRLREEGVEEVRVFEALLSTRLALEGNLVKLGDVTTIIDPNPSHRYPIYVDTGVPMISAVNFVGRDSISTANTNNVPIDFFEETIGKYNIQGGDVIFARKGKIGYARPYPSGGKIAMTHTLCVIQPNRSILEPSYLLYYTRYPFRGWLRTAVSALAERSNTR